MKRPFHLITTAPTDTAVEVLYGAPQAVALAIWDKQIQAWIRVRDQRRRVLYKVTGWRMLGSEQDK
jgi:hypothetical protein